jgi:hypothetical protein
MSHLKPGGYEAHMTFDKEHAQRVEYLGDEWGWAYSVITGCPLLGQGTYCYLTSYHPTEPERLRKDMELIEAAARSAGFPVLRSKIEHIVYDTKTGVNELETGADETEIRIPGIEGVDW